MVDDVPGVNRGMRVVSAASKVIHRPLCQRAAEPPVTLKVLSAGSRAARHPEGMDTDGQPRHP